MSIDIDKSIAILTKELDDIKRSIAILTKELDDIKRDILPVNHRNHSQIQAYQDLIAKFTKLKADLELKIKPASPPPLNLPLYEQPVINPSVTNTNSETTSSTDVAPIANNANSSTTSSSSGTNTDPATTSRANTSKPKLNAQTDPYSIIAAPRPLNKRIAPKINNHVSSKQILFNIRKQKPTTMLSASNNHWSPTQILSPNKGYTNRISQQNNSSTILGATNDDPNQADTIRLAKRPLYTERFSIKKPDNTQNLPTESESNLLLDNQTNAQTQTETTKLEPKTETKTDYKLFIESAIADAKKVGLFTRIIEAISSFFSSSGRDAKKRQFRKKLLKLSIPVSPNEEDEIIKKCKEFNFGDTSKILITQVEIKHNNSNNNQIQIESHHFRDKASQIQNIPQNTI